MSDFSAKPVHKTEVKDEFEPPCPDLKPIKELGRKLGYMITDHGSKKRDYDLIAVPWIEGAVPPEELVSAFESELNFKRLARNAGQLVKKPNGRVAINMQRDAWEKHIDLSIISPQPSPPQSDWVMKQKLLAKLLHYPDCWDDVAYPTLEAAADEVSANWKLFNGFTCSVCGALPLQQEAMRSAKRWGEKLYVNNMSLAWFENAIEAAQRDAIACASDKALRNLDQALNEGDGSYKP